MKKFPERLSVVLWLSLFYVFILIIWGYSYGRGNSLQLIPYAQFLNDRTLFLNDFFIQSADKNFPNERSFFIYLLQPFGKLMEWAAFIEHYIFSLLLFIGLFRIALFILKNRIYAYASLLILLIPFLFHTLGLNEIYANELASSLVAASLAVWSIYNWMKQKTLICYILLTLSTLIHPLVGLQTFILITGTQFIKDLLGKNLRAFFITTGPLLIMYFLTAGVFIYLLNSRFNDTAIDNSTFFQIFFVFRNAHHYIPSQYSTTDLIILIPLYLATPLLIYKYNKDIFIFCLLIITGCVIYTIGVESFQSIFFAETQWFKSTYYLEFFMILSGLLLMQKVLPSLKEVKYAKIFFTGLIIFCAAWAVFVLPGIETSKNLIAYEFPFYKKVTPEIDISRKAKELTPKNALFIQPCTMDQLKYYGQRSGYVDYKGITHSKSFITEWANRFNEIYQIDPVTSNIISFEVMKLADENYKSLKEDYLLKLKNEKGITHMIVPVEVKLNFKTVSSNSAYTIYEL